tara:strand:- start:269 stop:1180 length:912 start_codon:yes stop_codon:yes gene_type:complete
MNIILPSYSSHYNLCPIKSEEEANGYGMTYKHDNDADYTIYWGMNPTKLHSHKKYGVMETGFFKNAAFIDTVGAYQACSLNTKHAYDEISNFDLGGRSSAKEIISNFSARNRSKYNATHGRKEPFDQTIVLACQNPKDRSIGYPHSGARYWEFIEECCKYYGKNLFVKLHPWNSGEYAEPFFEIGKRYGCEVSKCHMSLIKDKEFVISFNSTMAIDCILNDVPYVQYAMGTFWNCFGIHFSNYSCPSSVDPTPNADKLVDFLMYKYCFNKGMNKDKYAEMIKVFARSRKVFPLNDHYCYANNI